jgi:hypothetical protein
MRACGSSLGTKPEYSSFPSVPLQVLSKEEDANGEQMKGTRGQKETWAGGTHLDISITGITSLSRTQRALGKLSPELRNEIRNRTTEK